MLLFFAFRFFRTVKRRLPVGRGWLYSSRHHRMHFTILDPTSVGANGPKLNPSSWSADKIDVPPGRRLPRRNEQHLILILVARSGISNAPIISIVEIVEVMRYIPVTRRIGKVRGAIVHIGIEVDSCNQSKPVLTHEPAKCR